MKFLFSLLLLVFGTIGANAQAPKKSKPTTATAKVPVTPAVKTYSPTQDSITVKGAYSQDTVKAVVLTLTEENFVQADKVYVINRLFTPLNDKPISVGQTILKADYTPYNPEKSLQVLPFKW